MVKNVFSTKIIKLFFINTMIFCTFSLTSAADKKTSEQISDLEKENKVLECKTNPNEKSKTEEVVESLLKNSKNEESDYFLENVEYHQACEAPISERIKESQAELDEIKSLTPEQFLKKYKNQFPPHRGSFMVTKKLMYGQGSNRLCGEPKAIVKLACVPQSKYEIGINDLTMHSWKKTIDTGSDYTYFIKAFFPSSQEEREQNLILARKWNKFQEATAKYLTGDYFITDRFMGDNEESTKQDCLRKLSEYEKINLIYNFKIKKEGARLFISNNKKMSGSSEDFAKLVQNSKSTIKFDINDYQNSKLPNHAIIICSVYRNVIKKNEDKIRYTRLAMHFDMDGAKNFCYNHPNRIGSLNHLNEIVKGDDGDFFKNFDFQKLSSENTSENLIVNTYYNEIEAPVFAISDRNKNFYFSMPHTSEVLKLYQTDTNTTIIRLLLDFKNNRSIAISYKLDDPENPTHKFASVKEFVGSNYWRTHKDDWRSWNGDPKEDVFGVDRRAIYGLRNCEYSEPNSN
jgi:hypothetical protein